MLLTATLLSCCMVFVGVMVRASRRGRVVQERDCVVLFETRVDPPYQRPVFTALSDELLHVDAPVIHARLASGVLHLVVRSDNGGETVGFEVAVTNVELDWLRGDTYRHFRPESQLLIGPLGEATDRLLARTAEAHTIELPEQAHVYVQAYEVAAVTCDPAEDTLRVEVDLPGGQRLRIAYDYARASVAGNVPVHALRDVHNVQALAVRLAA